MNCDRVDVSVIMPCFNNGDHIDEAVRSVLEQSFDAYELIIVDDFSNDGVSVEKIKNMTHPKIRKIFNKQNLGVCVSRNEAIKVARGKYILPMDADDKIHRDYLRLAFRLMDADIADVVYCQAELFGAKSGKWKLVDYDANLMLYHNMVFNCAMYRKADWALVGGYSEMLKSGYEDWDFWISLAEKCKRFYRINKTFFYYRVKELSRNIDASQRHDSLMEIIYGRHNNYYIKHGILSPPKLSDVVDVKKNHRLLLRLNRWRALLKFIFAGW